MIEIETSDCFFSFDLDKKKAIKFEEDYTKFEKKWNKIIKLFEGKFIYRKDKSKNISYSFFIEDSGYEYDLSISSSDYNIMDDAENIPNFNRAFIKFLSKGEGSDTPYSFGLDPFETKFYSELHSLLEPYIDISFDGTVTSLNTNEVFRVSYNLTKKGMDLDAREYD